MSEYAVAHLDEIDELEDGRCPYRPVRHHFGITAFGLTAWTAREAGDWITNEHDESDDGQEELYLVQRGRAVFELDGERLDASTGTFVYVPSGVKRTAHLRQAIDRAERLRSFAKEDSDLDPIRDEPAFQELVGD